MLLLFPAREQRTCRFQGGQGLCWGCKSEHFGRTDVTKKEELEEAFTEIFPFNFPTRSSEIKTAGPFHAICFCAQLRIRTGNFGRNDIRAQKGIEQFSKNYCLPTVNKSADVRRIQTNSPLAHSCNKNVSFLWEKTKESIFPRGKTEILSFKSFAWNDRKSFPLFWFNIFILLILFFEKLQVK